MLACTYVQHLYGLNNNTALMHAYILNLCQIISFKNIVEMLRSYIRINII